MNDPARPSLLGWLSHLAVPLLAAGFALAGIVHASGEDLDGVRRSRPDCSTTLTDDVLGFDGGLAVLPSGDVLVSQGRAGCVIRIDERGVGRLAIGGGRRTDACPACEVRIRRPSEIEVGPDGTVFVLDQAEFRILAVRSDGTAAEVATGGDRFGAVIRTFTRDARGRLYVADGDEVRRLDPSGPVVIAGGGGDDVVPGASATAVRLGPVTDMAVGPDGTVYLAQRPLFRVLRVHPGGTISVFAGTGVDGDSGDGGPATEASVVPGGLAADDAGNVYISVEYGHRVRRVDAAGRITGFAGRGLSRIVSGPGDGGPAALAALGYPTDLAFHQGSLYILDEGSRPRIRKVDRAGTITTVAGGG